METLDNLINIEDKSTLSYGIKLLERDIERAADAIPGVKERKDKILSEVKNIKKKGSITFSNLYKLAVISLDIASPAFYFIQSNYDRFQLEDEKITAITLLLNRITTYSHLYRSLYVDSDEETRRKMSEYNYKAFEGEFWDDLAESLTEKLGLNNGFSIFYDESKGRIVPFSSQVFKYLSDKNLNLGGYFIRFPIVDEVKHRNDPTSKVISQTHTKIRIDAKLLG